MVELSCPNCGTEWVTEADEQAKAYVHCPDCDYKVQLPGSDWVAVADAPAGTTNC